jgi:large subunit ribosomal protein L14e
MPYTQFVEVGRVALISFGSLVDQLAVIADIIDDKRVLVDLVKAVGSRQVISVRRLKLTDFKLNVPRAAPSSDIAAAIKAEAIEQKWDQSNWGKKLAARMSKQGLSDFQRFKYGKLAVKRNEFVKQHLCKR